MRETKFIEQNSGKWSEFETTLREGRQHPEKLTQLFVEITDDLSYARSFYPNRSVRVYLNHIAQQVFYSIYRNRRMNWSRFVHFWKEELPGIVWDARKNFLLAFIIFTAATALGVVSTLVNPDFPREFLGDSYIDNTLQNIADGDPMRVYKDPHASMMTLDITWNNLQVSLLMFVTGLLFGVGTIYLLINNGIMLGTFFTFLFQQGKDVFQEALLTVWMHGTLEISAIIIAGAAGLELGRGLVFPGTLTRMQSFQLSGRRALKIFIGITPMIVMAGMIEGFLTRFTNLPGPVRFVFILVCFVAVLYYFVIYPFLLARRRKHSNLQEVKLPPSLDYDLEWDKVKGVGTIFADTFAILRGNIARVFYLSSLLAGLTTWLMLTVQHNNGNRYFILDAAPRGFFSTWISELIDKVFSKSFENIGMFYSYEYGMASVHWLPEFVFLTCMGAMGFHIVLCKAGFEMRNIWTYGGKLLLVTAGAVFIHLFLLLSGSFGVVTYFLVTPVLLFCVFISMFERIDPFSAIARAFYLISAGFLRLLGSYVVMQLIMWVIVIVTVSPLSDLAIRFVTSNFLMSDIEYQTIKRAFLYFMHLFAFASTFPLMAIASGVTYFSVREIKEATTLKHGISAVGERKKIYGMETES